MEMRDLTATDVKRLMLNNDRLFIQGVLTEYKAEKANSLRR